MGHSAAIWVNTSVTPNTVDSSNFILANYSSANKWGTITPLGTSNGGFPRIKMDAAANTFALWTDAGNNVNVAYMPWVNNFAPIGGTWSAPTILNTTSGNANVSLAVDPVGNAAAVWQDGASNIWGAFQLASGVWGAAVNIGAGVTPEVSRTIGNVIAVWSDLNQNILYATLPYNGTWTAGAQPLATNSILPKVGPMEDSAAAVVGTDLLPTI